MWQLLKLVDLVKEYIDFKLTKKINLLTPEKLWENEKSWIVDLIQKKN